ncbi:MAG: hypothetical protein DMD53_03295 [Gemmatimonadetes bacterium]|nr:MAG: hypothetical protein DMD53_03295 [Gemmatimonadota bacterium]
MSVRRHLIPLALAVFAARCADGPHPTGVQQPLAPAPHFLRWAGGSAPQLTTIGTGSGGAGHGVFLASPGGLSLDQYTATFWAVRGEERSLQINYFSVTGDTSSPFLRLVVDDPAYVPGLGDLAPGDSVLMTVTIDPSNIKVTLEPTGLLFGNPAQLQVWYGGAGGDLNGDGVVDDADAWIEAQLLGMWYREGADGSWTAMPAAQSLADKSFTSALPHFSEYALCWD